MGRLRLSNFSKRWPVCLAKTLRVCRINDLEAHLPCALFAKRNQRHLRRLLKDYVRYYHEDRTHLGLGKDTPGGRVVVPAVQCASKIISLPRLGGLHHRYMVAA